MFDYGRGIYRPNTIGNYDLSATLGVSLVFLNSADPFDDLFHTSLPLMFGISKDSGKSPYVELGVNLLTMDLQYTAGLQINTYNDDSTSFWIYYKHIVTGGSIFSAAGSKFEYNVIGVAFGKSYKKQW